MRRLWNWTKAGWRWLGRAFTPSPAAWSGAAAALFALWLLVLIALGWDDLVLRFTLEKAIGFAILSASLAVISAVLLVLLWLSAKLDGRYRVALLLSLPLVALLSLVTWQGKGVGLLSPALLLGVSLFAGAGWSLLRRTKRLPWGTFVFLFVGAAPLGTMAFLYLRPHADPNPALANYHLHGQTLALPDPGKPGSFAFTTFTYGSGSDRHRPEFSSQARFVTKPVDGSKLDTKWRGFGGWLRTRYWGFDAKKLPLQGRVWMPKGAGPFPLVLIVHGNHEMEDFSDPGYAYLGELLASRGFIFVSVDENFLNSSLADYADFFHLRLGSENRVRGWLLLEQLAQWRDWNRDAKSPLFGKIDLNRIGLIGHSRGGEAVAVAAAFNSLAYYPDDATVRFDFRFKLGAIAAIAPADGQYMPRHRPTPMRDTNYFVIQGSMDGDVYTFAGSAQYSRATFSDGSKAFKASLYVKDANHGQFNTSWGRSDVSPPMGVFLDKRPILDAEAQRRVAKVYLSAFLEETLHGKEGYRPLFQDARFGAAWLPDVYLVNNYADGATRLFANYEEDLDPASATAPGGTINGNTLSVWREDYVDLKDEPLDSHVAVLAWDNRFHRGASYAIVLAAADAKPAMSDDLVFSAAAADVSTLPENFNLPAGVSNDPVETALDWTVVLRDAHGNEARLALSHDQVLYPPIKGDTRRIAEASSIPRSEIVMRRYRFPMRDFAADNPKLDLAELRTIRFDFDKSPRGAIALDDIGLAPTR